MLDQLTTPDTGSHVEAPKKSRWVRRLLVVLASTVCLSVLAAGAFALFLNQRASSNIQQADLLPGAGPSPAGSPDPDATAPVAPATPTARAKIGKNYLIIGSDALPGQASSRSDVIVLMHVPEDKQAAYLIHFPRDLYVSIPGRGKDKINAAYAYGGAPLLVSTLQNLLGAKIDHVAKTDFTGFRRMTDAVGGVRVYAEEASAGSGTVAVRQGWNDLNGEQALAFVRERYDLSTGDISRGRRQQAFIKALMMKATSREVLTNPVKLAKLIDAATANLVVDKKLSVSEARTQAVSMRGLRSEDVVFITAPITGFGTAPNGGAIDIVDRTSMAALGEALRTDDMGTYADVSVIP